MRCRCHCDGCTVGRVWHAPDREELLPEGQWYNMPEEVQVGQECSEGQEGQEEQEEEARAEREMQEDLVRRTEEYGAAGEEEGTQRTGWKSAVARRPRTAQVGRGALEVVQEGPNAEEKKRDDLEKAALCKGRTEADRQYREQAAVAMGREAAKRARVDRKEGGDGAAGTARQRSGRAKRTLPGPPHIYTMYGTKVEARGSAAVEQLSDARREVQVAADRKKTPTP